MDKKRFFQSSSMVIAPGHQINQHHKKIFQNKFTEAKIKENKITNKEIKLHDIFKNDESFYSRDNKDTFNSILNENKIKYTYNVKDNIFINDLQSKLEEKYERENYYHDEYDYMPHHYYNNNHNQSNHNSYEANSETIYQHHNHYNQNFQQKTNCLKQNHNKSKCHVCNKQIKLNKDKIQKVLQNSSSNLVEGDVTSIRGENYLDLLQQFGEYQLINKTFISYLLS